jgi:sulfatase maturation enzyme AslB (radical SAM superfamily)
VLITDEILDFCRQHKIYLSSSLDGPEDLHNKNRPRPERNSYELFLKGLNRSRDILGVDGISALMTTSPSSLGRVKDIIDKINPTKKNVEAENLRLSKIVTKEKLNDLPLTKIEI